MAWSKEEMAFEVINMLNDGATVNLGIGMPTLVAELMPSTKNIMIQSENGVMGVGERPTAQTVSPTLINAGKETITVIKGASFFDSSLSFGMIRGGHIDYCILGGMEVDVDGNLANWMVPGQKITGMGGAMDLVNGAKQVIIMMSHFNKNGTSKFVTRCQLPLTGTNVVDKVVTELGVFSPAMGKFKIIKLASGTTKESLGDSTLYI
ncbi:MAG: 3-oxoacid CoA-transferase subunit B [Bdellovibrio sp.]|nr:3-oxoacid CoA-transferase subunit B [Bdellovibrio sp.]